MLIGFEFNPLVGLEDRVKANKAILGWRAKRLHIRSNPSPGDDERPDSYTEVEVKVTYPEAPGQSGDLRAFEKEGPLRGVPELDGAGIIAVIRNLYLETPDVGTCGSHLAHKASECEIWVDHIDKGRHERLRYVASIPLNVPQDFDKAGIIWVAYPHLSRHPGAENLETVRKRSPNMHYARIGVMKWFGEVPGTLTDVAAQLAYAMPVDVLFAGLNEKPAV